MQERLDVLRIVPQVVLDAGCGEGDDLLALQQRYAKARMIGLDVSAAMLALAKALAAVKSPWQRWIGQFFRKDRTSLFQADFAATSLPNDSVDLLWSNLALQWHPQPFSVFQEWYRIMRPEGALMFSCFGIDTFKELRDAFALIDDAPHTLAFADMHDVGDQLLAAGFPSPVMDRETITLTYENAKDLVADVRAFGGNPLIQRRRGLLSRAQGARVMQALETMRDPNGFMPLTVEVVYGHAFKFASTRGVKDEAVVRFVKRG
ncbi:MAG: methyltransferase domain-containing protein [Oxalobacter sp.]|nr:MAG: methyltransferase domain-containing protein [Oxalobacter sp.]